MADLEATPDYRRARLTLFGIGLAISCWMVLRSQMGGDQFKLLVLGWELWANGELRPYGTGMSGGGLLPGALSGLFAGLPLFAWHDYRAAGAFTLLFHVGAYLLLDRTLRGVLTPKERLLFCALYWINPWRMYHSAHVWNPNWIFLFSAVHLWSAFGQRRRRSFALSLLHVLAIGLAFQVHGSFLILAVLSALLFWRGYLNVHWLGAACGALLTALTLVPWILAALDNPHILPMHDGFPLRGLLLVYPTLRGVLYLLRMPSMHFGRKMVDYDFTPALGDTADAVLTPPFWVVSIVIGSASVVAVAAAHWWFWRRNRGIWLDRLPPDHTDRQWLIGVLRWTLIAAVGAFMLSPKNILNYYVFIVFHAAVLPVALWLGHLWAAARPPWIGRALAAHRWTLVAIAVAMTLGSPMYRNGGRNGAYTPLREMHPLVDDLRVNQHSRAYVDEDIGIVADPLFHASTRAELRAGDERPLEPGTVR